jgi:hypothetical protein
MNISSPLLTDGSSEGMSRLPSVSGLSRNPHHNMVLVTIIEQVFLTVKEKVSRGNGTPKTEDGGTDRKGRGDPAGRHRTFPLF